MRLSTRPLLQGLVLSSTTTTAPPPFKFNPFKMATPLPPLPEIDRLTPGCIRILGGNPDKFALQGTNTYLLGTGPRRLLIDTGEGKPSWIAALTKVLREEGASVQAALLTHWHHDHVGGVGNLVRE